MAANISYVSIDQIRRQQKQDAGGPRTLKNSHRRRKSTAARPFSATNDARTKLTDVLDASPTLFDVNRISVVEKYVTALDRLPEKYVGAAYVFLSKNNLTSLAGVEQFADARVVSVASNCISDIDEIRHLQRCPQLQVLNMQYNPLTWMPFYRYHVLRRLPGLRSLDSTDVTASEHSLAGTIVAKEASTLRIMVQNECHIMQMEEALNRLRLVG